MEAVPTTYTIYKDGKPTEICVEWRDTGLWAVTRTGRGCLKSSGRWDIEPNPSSRTDAWKRSHRFPLDKAIELAKEAAKEI